MFTMLANWNNCQVLTRAADEKNHTTAAIWLHGSKESVVYINAMEYYSAVTKTKLSAGKKGRSGGHHVKEKKPGPERQACFLSYVEFILKKKRLEIGE